MRNLRSSIFLVLTFLLLGTTAGFMRTTAAKPDRISTSIDGFITRISINDDGIEGNGHSIKPNISGDARYVVFYSEATNLVSNDDNDHADFFVYDRKTSNIERISDGLDDVSTYWYDNPAISADGRYIVSRATLFKQPKARINEQMNTKKEALSGLLRSDSTVITSTHPPKGG